jgi:hypothetical protein
VRDSAGGSISAATVTAKNKATNITQQSKTDNDGYYNFPSLSIGNYEVSVELPGFQNTTREALLETAQKARLDFRLEIGSVNQKVDVEASIPQLSPQDASVSSVIDNNIISQVPQYLRSWDDLSLMVAGVHGYRYTEQSGSPSSAKQGRFSVHGVRDTQNNYVLDGMDNNVISTNWIEDTQMNVRPSLDDIQEFRLITNPYNAEYGRSPGSAVVVSTKGGTNAIHGSVYEYFRNRVFDANDFLSNRSGQIKPKNNQNQFGATAGGPAIKNKLFWYGDYEGTRLRKGILRLTSVPLPNERIGDFSTQAAAKYGVAPYPAIFDPATGAPFANNQIPAGRIDPSARKIMDQFPLPNILGTTTNNFVRTPSIQDDTNRYSGRIDWQPDSKNAVFGRYTYTPRLKIVPGYFGGIADGSNTGGWGNRQLDGQAASLGWTRPITPALVNELRVGFTRNHSYVTQEPFGNGKASDFIPGIPHDAAFDGGMPNVQISGFGFIGSPNFLPNFQITQQWQFADSISWNTGKHSLKVGTDVHAPLRDIWIDVPATRGQVAFDRLFSCQRDPTNRCTGNTGLSYADFLLGQVYGAQLSNMFIVDHRWHMYSFFGQDDWKVTPKLTVNIGLRYDYASPAVDAHNRLANFNPAGSGSLVYAKSGSLDSEALTKPDRNNFGPRAGFAYQLSPKTVLRSGYGIFYVMYHQNGSDDQLALNPPQFINNNISLANNASAPLFTLQQGFPSNYLDPSQLDLHRIGLRAVNPDNRSSMVQQWSFGIQQALPAGFFMEVNYVGTASSHLRSRINLNQKVNGITPYPNFGSIGYYENFASANYHGLEATVERRFLNGVSVRGAYTLSKSIDDGSAAGSTSQDPHNRVGSRGPSDFDVTHRFVGVYNLELPFGKGKPFLQQGFMSKLLGGFSFTGSVTMQTGRPFSVTASNNNSNLDGTSFAKVIGPVTYPNQVGCWFYSSTSSACKSAAPNAVDAFATPQRTPSGDATFGNAGRNLLRGPGLHSFDASLHRMFSITERQRVELRWEVFNASNTAQFGQPNSNINDRAVGSITSLTADPRVMQFALRYKF